MIRADTDKIIYTNTNDVGRFEFKNVEAGDYKLEITSPGFKDFVLRDLHVTDSMDITAELTVNAEELVGGLMIALDPIDEPVAPQVSTQIQSRPTIPIPTERAEPVKSSKSKSKKNKGKLPK